MYIARGKKVQDKIKDWNFINQKVVIRERFLSPIPQFIISIFYIEVNPMYLRFIIFYQVNCKPNLDQIY